MLCNNPSKLAEVERKLAPSDKTGPAVILPASTGYPLLSCASAELNSVSPASQSLTH